MMENKSRTQKSIKNIIYAMGGYAVTLILQLVNRLVFVKCLSVEYLGINGLFTNILSMLALSELGIGTAIVFALYKPVAEKNIEKIKSLMALYKKLYTVIGCFVLIVGFSLTPFLHYLIKEMPNIEYLQVYYMLYVLNSGLSYFYSYKRSLIICNQDEYISTATTMLATVATRVVQIVVLLLTKNYFLFLVIQIIFTRLENVVIARIADKQYPYLKEKDIKPLQKQEKDGIRNNVLAMMLHKIGDVVVNATDNLIISKIIGLAAVGLLSNYTMIFETITGLITKIFSAITASLGNMVVTEDKEKGERVFRRILFANFWLISFCTICLVCLIQPFIKFWLGEDFLLSIETVLALTGCFYLTGMRRTALQFRTAAGLFWQDRYKAIIEGILNLAISIPLTIHMGITGVKLGTCISTLLTSFWIEGLILFKHYFKKSAASYLLLQLIYGCMTVIAGATAFWLCEHISGNSFVALLVKGVICVVLVNGSYLLLFWRRPEFEYYRDMVKSKFILKVRK